jgi:hypothetical protein
MKWLLTVSDDTDLDALARELLPFGCVLEDVEGVPMGEGDVVVFADGPDDLPDRLQGIETQVKSADPSSEFELHY